MKKAMVYIGILLFVAGAGLSIVLGGKAYAEIQSVQAKKNTSDKSPPSISEPNRTEEDGESAFVWEDRPDSGEKIGILSLPEIDREVQILEGTGDKELSEGVGHHESSVLFGEPDRSVLAGHRETALRHLDRIKSGDFIRIETEGHIFIYEAEKHWIADDDDPRVVASNGKQKPELILYSCYPLDAVYTGYAPKRYVLQAELTEIQKK